MRLENARQPSKFWKRPLASLAVDIKQTMIAGFRMLGIDEQDLTNKVTNLSELFEVRLNVFDCCRRAEATNEHLFRLRDQLYTA